jgi:hypothetical protein
MPEQPRSISSEQPARPAPDWLWAAYLAVSWTWCIGMFLPVILVGEFGITGWVVFAIPNIVGAAAFGWAVRDRDHADRLLATHGRAMVVFSLVTIAFQIFFATWFFGRLNMLPAIVACLMVAGALRVLGSGRPALDRIAASAGFLISLAILGWWIVHLSQRREWSDFSSRVFIRPGAVAMGLVPVCFFGFALCPYLDLTFYAARRDMAAGSARRAFGWGFGLCFLLMIVLSLLYAPAISATLAGKPTPRFLMYLVAIHVVIQLSLTIVFHARATLEHLSERRGSVWLGGSVVTGIFIGITALAVGQVPMPAFSAVGRLDAGELAYRLFLSFYGLIFPAYAWICMAGSFRNPAPPAAAQLRIVVFAIVIAAPMFAMGFLADRPLWLIPGVALVLFARLVAWRKDADSPIMPSAGN